MPAIQQRRSSGPAPESASTESSTQSDSPVWAEEAKQCSGNAGMIEMITGLSLGEEEATSMLDGAAEETEEQGPQATPSTRPGGKLGVVYDKHQNDTQRMGSRATAEHAWSLNFFKKTYEANRGRYEAVAAATSMPAKLIAALHFRESSMDFGTYLHQGDPLGRPAVNHPANIPIFHVWEEAAIHALTQKSSIRDSLNMDQTTEDPAALATYAERYNGLGYHNRGSASPYVYAGTDVYTGGKYVRDGVYDASVHDRNPGVMALMMAVEGVETSPEWASTQSTDEAWQTVLAGHQVLRHGQRGPEVRALQEKLTAAGHATGIDGHFGNGTRGALLAFQTANGLEADGRVGPKTAEALEKAGSAPAVADCDPAQTAEQAPEASTEVEVESPGARLWQAVLDGGQLLRKGSQGDVVKELQRRLVEMGQSIKVDGDFGRRTRAAVIAVQQALGLGADGIVGPRTAEKL